MADKPIEELTLEELVFEVSHSRDNIRQVEASKELVKRSRIKRGKSIDEPAFGTNARGAIDIIRAWFKKGES